MRSYKGGQCIAMRCTLIAIRWELLECGDENLDYCPSSSPHTSPHTAAPIIHLLLLSRNPPRAITDAGLAEIEGPGLRACSQQANCSKCADKQSAWLAAEAWRLFRKQFYDDRMHFVGEGCVVTQEGHNLPRSREWSDHGIYCHLQLHRTTSDRIIELPSASYI